MPDFRRLSLTLATAALLAACTEQPSTSPGRSVSVPPGGAPADCPAPGVLITADRGDAAMGYREMSLHLKNCGGTAYRLYGKPDIVVLDEERNRVDVALLPSAHHTAAPRQLTIEPGDGAMAVLSWRNTVTDPAVVATTGVFLSIAPVQGAPRQTVRLPRPLDLGNTGRLETSAWF